MKKRYYTLIGILFMGLSLFAQNEIPNADFENWTNGEPNEWFTSNVAGTVINVTQTGDAQNGASAAFGEVADVAGTPFPPTLASGVQGNGAFPITERYTTLNGHYRLNSIDGEAISVTVLILDANSAALGTGFLTLDQPTSTYTSFSVPIVYGFSGDAAFATIVFNILNLSGSLPIVGASMHIDNLSFSTTTGVEPVDGAEIAETFQLKQNYPNPFNPSTTIEFSTTKTSNVKLTIFNPLGQEVETLVNEELTPGTYKADWQPQDQSGGIYFYQLEADGFVETKKLVLLK